MGIIIKNSESNNDRVAIEKEFHESRFRKKNREVQEKYYAAIEGCAREFTEKLMKAAHGADILEFGCGSDCLAHSVAGVCRSVTAIDMSDVAVSCMKKKSADMGIFNTKFMVMNPKMLDFDNGSFDLVFGRGIISHLDVRLSFFQMVEVLRPDGIALFWEPVRHIKRDVEIANMYFRDVNVRFYGLFSLLSVPFMGTRFGDFLLKITSAIDRLILVLPFLKWKAWYCLLEMKNPRRNETEYLNYSS